MDDRSTISWMIMGGPRYDEHSQAELDHIRALNEQHIEYEGRESTGRLDRLVSFLDRWTGRPAAALTATPCTTDNCAA